MTTLREAERDLQWLMEYGTCAFERSPSGAILERQRIRRIRHRPDPAILAARLDRARRHAWQEPPPGAITAQPIRETITSEREEPDMGVLVRYGAATRKLERVAEADPQAARALALAFGADGAKWARHERGRVVALFPLVASGIAIVRRVRAAECCALCGHARSAHHVEPAGDDHHGPRPSCSRCKPCKVTGIQGAHHFLGGLDLSDADRLRVQVEVDWVTGGKLDRARRALITAATNEGHELLAHALGLWVGNKRQGGGDES